jgi:ABC-type nitrate/sulfonate/bicarbonate transport system ATPase subunit/ABC-type nitrate/sulfonate/bicarbonate transport system permease component
VQDQTGREPLTRSLSNRTASQRPVWQTPIGGASAKTRQVESIAEASAPIAPVSATLPRAIPRWVYALPLPVVAIIAWQLATAGKSFSLIPPPSTVAMTAWDYAFGGIRNDSYSATLLTNAIASIGRVYGGFFVAMVIALPLGLLLGRSKRARAFIDPTLQFLRPIPVTAWLPLTMIIFGLGPPATIALIALGTFFPMLLNTVDGVRLVEPRLIEAAEMLGTPKAAIFTRVILPAASPSIFTGIRIGLGLAWVLLVVGEMTGVPTGLGANIMDARQLSRTDLVISGMVFIGSACCGGTPVLAAEPATAIGVPAITARHLEKTYMSANRNGSVTETHALSDINLEIKQGEFICIIGASGCGKSTLLRIVAGFETVSSGELLVMGKPVTAPGPDRGMVFQDYALFPWLSVAQNIAYGPRQAGRSAAEIAELAERYLDIVGLQKFRNRYPHELSGGMKQRVAIARVLANDPAVILMDEPFGALDAFTRNGLQESLLHIWEAARKTILFITHSVDEAVYLSDRVIVLSPHPGRLKLELPIDLPRPRDIASVEFNHYKRIMLDAIAPDIAAEAVD